MRVFSAMQPSGQLHLGNYFGSMRPNVDLQKNAEEFFYFIVDLHALTTVHDPKELKSSIEEAILDYLACGFDPEKAVISRQSQVPEHTELMWILSTVTPVGLLERAVSYKEKVEQGISPSAGLFLYPVLMAADILLYQADTVPVGKDQKQHVEIARDVASKFNTLYGETFTLPEPLIRAEVAVVPGIDGRKMSKSYSNTIPLFGDEKEIRKAVMSIVTDSTRANEPKDPEKCIIFQIHKLFLEASEAKALADEYRSGLSYGEGKKRLLQTYLDHFAPMRSTRAKLTPAHAQAVLQEGARKAQLAAGKTMARVRRAVGLL